MELQILTFSHRRENALADYADSMQDSMQDYLTCIIVFLFAKAFQCSLQTCKFIFILKMI